MESSLMLLLQLLLLSWQTYTKQLLHLFRLRHLLLSSDNMEYISRLILLLVLLENVVHGGKVLFYTPFSSKSMKITFAPILEELVHRGHEVYAAMPFTDKKAKYIQISSDPTGDIIKMLDTVTEPMLKKTASTPFEFLPQIVNGAITLNENVRLLQNYLYLCRFINIMEKGQRIIIQLS